MKELVNEVKYLGDDGILRKVKLFFENYGFKIISPSKYIKQQFKKDEIVFNNKEYDKKKENYLLSSAKYGEKLLNKISDFDVGQAIVVKKSRFGN